MEYLLIVIAILSLLLAYEKRSSRIERAKLINAVIAKTAQDQVNLDLADKTKIKEVEAKPPAPPDLISTDQLSDTDLLKQIRKESGLDDA